jgi:hypothetical protein
MFDDVMVRLIVSAVIFRVGDRCNPSPHVDVMTSISQREIIAPKNRHSLVEALDLEVYIFNSDDIRTNFFFALTRFPFWG